MNQIDSSLVVIGGPLLPLLVKATWAALSSQNAAAWVQAIGSVAAILVAAWLPVRQRRLEAADARRAAHSVFHQVVTALLAISVNLQSVTTVDEFTRVGKASSSALRLLKVAVDAHVAPVSKVPALLEALLLTAYRLENAITALQEPAPTPERLIAERNSMVDMLNEDAENIRRTASQS